MRKYILVILGAIVIVLYLLWINRYSLGFISKVLTVKVPQEFTRTDYNLGATLGSRRYYKEGKDQLTTKYFYVLDYGIAANVPQEITLEKYMEAFKS